MKNLKITILLIGYCTVSGLYASQQQKSQISLLTVQKSSSAKQAVAASSSSSSSSSSSAQMNDHNITPPGGLAISSSSSSSSSAAAAAASAQPQVSNNKASAEPISPAPTVAANERCGIALNASCCTACCYEAVHDFLNQGVDVNSFYAYHCPFYDQYTCLRSAVYNGAEENAKLLMKWGANPYFTRGNKTFCVSDLIHLGCGRLSDEFISYLQTYVEQYTKKYGNKPPA